MGGLRWEGWTELRPTGNDRKCLHLLSQGKVRRASDTIQLMLWKDRSGCQVATGNARS